MLIDLQTFPNKEAPLLIHHSNSSFVLHPYDAAKSRKSASVLPFLPLWPVHPRCVHVCLRVCVCVCVRVALSQAGND